jgi:succinate dehydrogenase / fumarate reductase iron-sulfur subunit
MATITVKLKIWRQAGPDQPGRLVDYTAENVSTDMSFLEMLDVVNEELIASRQEAIAFESDCREGICGSCGLVINGVAHGPVRGATTCPVIKDLVVDRSALDRIIAAGGYISFNTGGAPDGNTIPIAKDVAEKAMDSAQCIQCGACVAQCKNASAHLFTSAKIQHLGMLPQGQPERYRRVISMLDQADAEGFGNCSNEGECEAVCPKEIPISNIARMYRDYYKALWRTAR